MTIDMFRMHKVGNIDVADIAAHFKVSPEAVYKRFRKLRRRMHELNMSELHLIERLANMPSELPTISRKYWNNNERQPG